MNVSVLGTVWDVILWFFFAYVLVAYLFSLVLVLRDIYRDTSLNGWLKAVWTLCLIFVPLLTVIVYLIVRGEGLNERNTRDMEASSEPADYTPRWGSGLSATDEIAKAQSLFQSGIITEDEFTALKAKALA